MQPDGRTTSLYEQLEHWARVKPHADALFDRGRTGAWRSTTWAQYHRAVRNAAKALIARGVKPGDCVALFGENSREWVFAQLGIMAAGAIPAPIYATSAPEQTTYILAHSRAKVAFTDSALVETLKGCVGRDGVAVEEIIALDGASKEGVEGLADFLTSGEVEKEGALEARLKARDPKETRLLIYTSGTTGRPKAVQITGRAFAAIVDASKDAFPVLFEPGNYRVVSYLPLSHMGEQTFTNVLHMATGGEVHFCRTPREVATHLREVRPTLFVGVPRVWEKLQTALQARLDETGGRKAALAAWAMRTELARFREELASGRPRFSVRRRLAHRLVLSRIQQALGLDCLLVAITGAAPTSMETLDFFASIGIVIHELWAMTEVGPGTCTEYRKPKFGTVGKPMRGVQVRIAEDGEVQVKGPACTIGYLHDEDATQALFTEDGWLRTGDVGRFDPDGNLRITGRKKEIILTAAGKNVAPAEIEGHLKSIPGVAHAVVVGEGRSYLTALVALEEESLDALRTVVGLPGASLGELARHPKLRAHLTRAIEERVNARLSPYQRVRKFEVLPEELTIERGELTPTLKVKRRVVLDRHGHLVEGLYSKEEAASRDRPAETVGGRS